MIKFLKNLLSITLIIILLFMIYAVFSTKILHKEAAIFPYQIKAVLSGSMEPEMKTGSVILIKTNVNPHQLTENDVISFITKDENIVTHRIIEANHNKEKFTTMGDANDVADMEAVLQENIIGQYTGISIPYLGYPLMFLNTKHGVALLFLLAGFSLLTYAVFNIISMVKQTKTQTMEE